MSLQSNRKLAIGQRSALIKHVISMSYNLSLRYGHVILVSRKLDLTGINYIINHNMMSFIKKAHRKPRLHVSVNLLFGAWLPCCATPLSSLSSCVPASNTARHDNINSWVSFTFLWVWGSAWRPPELRYELLQLMLISQESFLLL